MSQLETLAQHRDAILLAEAIGCLHDYRKCSEEQLQALSANQQASALPRNALTQRFPALSSATLSILSTSEQLGDLLNNSEGKWDDAAASFLMQFLSRCHNTAHFDKQGPGNGKQNYPGTQISTAFGFETAVGPNLTNQLWALPWNNLTAYTNNRNNLLTAVQSLFTMAGADTRRPINEVSLWDWGLLVGALYKSAIAATIIGHQPTTRDLRWRLLSIRTDGLVYLTGASRLPDLIGRQKTLQTALDNVQTLLEETYPLATEVYRDENGSLYVVPDMPNLLDLQNDENQTLLSHIQLQFKTDGEIVPQITPDTTAWWGQDPARNGNDEIPPAGRILAQEVTIQSDSQIIAAAWKEQHNQICPICGLRPCVSQQLNYCQVCRDRRQGRVAQWVQAQNTTIWLDEVADSNGRLALITGSFDLTNWLNGNLVETLLVQAPNSSPITKTPSFARLRRIWRTTQTFWQETQAGINEILSDSRRHLKINLANTPGLTIHQTYELDLCGQTRMSILWDGAHLMSIDNLSYTAIQLGIKPENRKNPADAALAVGMWLEENKQNVFQLISDDEKNRRFDIQIADVDYQDAAYATAIPILAEPRTFMALVPADKALDVAKAIKTKYQREIGKVRNRLPLHLGVVYAHRRTPLRTVLDAGRRMLNDELGRMKDEAWEVEDVTRLGPDDLPPELVEGTKQFDLTIAVKLKQNNRLFTWHVPAKMGDGQTDDNWYPYVFVCNDTGISDRALKFNGLRPTGHSQAEACWLIHAGELKKSDQVYFSPATFDFEWLDTTARRFEIAYDDTGKRYGRLTRPYLLDDLGTIREAWRLIAGPGGLTSSQIHALRETIETRRQAWQASPQEETLRRLCRAAIRNAQWKNRPAAQDVDRLIEWAVSGLLADALELYMGVMKARPNREPSQEQNYERNQ